MAGVGLGWVCSALLCSGLVRLSKVGEKKEREKRREEGERREKEEREMEEEERVSSPLVFQMAIDDGQPRFRSRSRAGSSWRRPGVLQRACYDAIHALAHSLSHSHTQAQAPRADGRSAPRPSAAAAAAAAAARPGDLWRGLTAAETKQPRAGWVGPGSGDPQSSSPSTRRRGRARAARSGTVGYRTAWLAPTSSSSSHRPAVRRRAGSPSPRVPAREGHPSASGGAVAVSYGLIVASRWWCSASAWHRHRLRRPPSAVVVSEGPAHPAEKDDGNVVGSARKVLELAHRDTPSPLWERTCGLMLGPSSAAVGPLARPTGFSSLQGKECGTVVLGRWAVVGGPWQVAGGRWQVAGGPWSVVLGRWPVVAGLRAWNDRRPHTGNLQPAETGETSAASWTQCLVTRLSNENNTGTPLGYSSLGYSSSLGTPLANSSSQLL
ncbi:IR4 protein [Drepanopeziza brunnea f. sp. 'multigermtubi' MB_m1]|uniref:IR4 protein n=1 Tax=Marssonina brunnea f. sp. multigermtubi (strain MB_m1) TaxID=1072389 RepID=K1XHK8_MARBU|nr:IR4 protein [Drepanopeziza brunnea f. sp. 'multigermtubi' MB_m1]EKD11944.1 IR4 protein [Drepanopeziza brunnea f. sp. 'multigermtubi' MB_m1]